MDVAFFESITPYWVDFHNRLNSYGFRCYYIYDSIYSYDSVSLKKDLDFEPLQLRKGDKNSFRFSELIDILKKERPKHVISVEYSLLTVQLLLLKPFFGYSLISRCDDSYDIIFNPISTRHKFASKILVPMIDNMILCDKSTCEYYKSKYNKGIYFPIIRDDVKYRIELENSLALSNDLISKLALQNRKVVLFVGRLSPEKNIGIVIEALAKTAEKPLFVLVGDGPCRASLENLAVKESVDVLFTGRLSGLDLYAWYNIADLLVLTSFNEAFGAVVNEALIAGCRCIVSKLAGSSGLISEKNGSLIDPYSVDSVNNAFCHELGLLNGRNKSAVKDNLMPQSFEDYIGALKESLINEN